MKVNDFKVTYAMIKRDGIDDHETRQIVFVRHVISMPCNDVERTVLLQCLEIFSLIFTTDFVRHFTVLEPGNGGQEISRLSETIGSLK